MNSSSPCGGMSVSIFVFLALCYPLLETLLWLVFLPLRLVWTLLHSTKMLQQTVYKFIKSLRRYFCFYFRVFAIMLTSAQDLTMAHFTASWTRLDTAACPENAPKNCLWIHQLLVEVFLFLFSCFCHYANLCSGVIINTIPCFSYQKAVIIIF